MTVAADGTQLSIKAGHHTVVQGVKEGAAAGGERGVNRRGMRVWLCKGFVEVGIPASVQHPMRRLLCRAIQLQ